MKKVAHVIVDIPSYQIDYPFSYIIPKKLDIKIGSGVVVPFRNGLKVGYVIGITEEIPKIELKEIIGIIDQAPVFSQDLLELVFWISNFYISSLSSSLKLILPPGKNRSIKKISDDLYELSKPKASKVFESWVKLINKNPEKLSPKQKVVFDYFNDEKIRKKDLMEKTGCTNAVISALAKKGVVEIYKEQAKRSPNIHFNENYKKARLNNEQKTAFSQINLAINSNNHQIFLLQGKTASGKTEVYFHAIREALDKDKGIIFLLPEISLTPQLVARLKSRFGDEVAILHSNMSIGERFDQFEQIRDGACRIVVGARSAVFAPVKNLGLIIIDEEHESTYKQNSSPRYHCREVAIKRAKIKKATVVLGSASPSIESRYKADIGKYKLLRLNQKAVSIHKSYYEIIDMTKEDKKALLGKDLKESISISLEDGHKALIFLNRRGYANFLLCTDCGFVPHCPNCAVSLTYHQTGFSLRCHHCNYYGKAASTCPKCQNNNFTHYGVGTEQMEHYLAEAFSQAKVVRMDGDSTRKKGAHFEKINEFSKANKAILLGTQMIAKGLDFHDITVVGVVNADSSLGMPDFRAEEKTFQLILQVSGRTGRGAYQGSTLVQTFCPKNNSINLALKEDYDSFYEIELERRRELNYPPFSLLINIGFTGTDSKKVKDLANKAHGQLKNIKSIQLVGPSVAPISKIKGKYRWHLLAKVFNKDGFLALKKEILKLKSAKDLKIIIDVDPQSML